MRVNCALIALSVVAAVGCGDSSAPIYPYPSVPRLVIVSGDLRSVEVGTAHRLTGKLLDERGAPVLNHVVAFRGDDGRADSVLTDANGIASIAWILPHDAREYRIEGWAFFGSTRPAGATWRVPVVAGPPRSLTSIHDVNAVVAPETELDTLTVRVTDRYGNPVGDVAVSWSFVGDGSFNPLQTRTNAVGRANALWTVGERVGRSLVEVKAGDSLAVQFTATVSTPFSASFVSAGDDHSCAIDVAGAAYCWGANDFGQLGIGTVDGARRNPVKAAGGLTFVSLAVGHAFTCGLITTGEAFCWGANDVAQLGTGLSGISSSMPVRVAGGRAFTALAAGRRHACGLTSGGEVYCWGENTVGQSGTGSPGVHGLPLIVRTTERFTAISAGDDFTCALSEFGEAFCWGNDARRQLGGGPARCIVGTAWDEYEGEHPAFGPCSDVPVRVATPSNLVSLVSGPSSSCAVTAAEWVACWGDGLTNPIALEELSGERTVAIGMGIVCGLDTGGALLCSGFSAQAAASVANQPWSFASLTGSASHLCAVSRDARPILYCWGSNDFGQLGDGTSRRRPFPVAVVSLPDP